MSDMHKKDSTGTQNKHRILLTYFIQLKARLDFTSHCFRGDCCPSAREMTENKGKVKQRNVWKQNRMLQSFNERWSNYFGISYSWFDACKGYNRDPTSKSGNMLVQDMVEAFPEH